MGTPRQIITFGQTGQTLALVPPEVYDGAPTAVSVDVFAGTVENDGTADFSPTPTVDATSTTTDAAAGISQHAAAGGRKRIPLTSTSGVAVGKSYLIQNLVGQRELVRVVSLSSNDYVDVEHDLANDYPTGSAFLGCEITAPVNDTWAATKSRLNYPDDPYRVRWVYTVAGVTRRHWTYADLVHVPGKHGVTVGSLLGEWPTLLYQLSREERIASADRLIGAAWDRVVYDLEMAGIDQSTLRDAAKVDMLVKEAALMIAGERGECPPGRDSEQWARERAAIYRRDLEKSISGNRLIRSEGVDSAIATDAPRAGWFVS